MIRTGQVQTYSITGIHHLNVCSQAGISDLPDALVRSHLCPQTAIGREYPMEAR